MHICICVCIYTHILSTSHVCVCFLHVWKYACTLLRKPAWMHVLTCMCLYSCMYTACLCMFARARGYVHLLLHCLAGSNDMLVCSQLRSCMYSVYVRAYEFACVYIICVDLCHLCPSMFMTYVCASACKSFAILRRTPVATVFDTNSTSRDPEVQKHLN